MPVHQSRAFHEPLHGTDALSHNGPDAIEGLRELLQEADRALDLGRVYLFGSRARGDARENSDVDLAFEHASSPADWADFVNSAQEQAMTLLDLDLVDLARASAELRERVMKEGVLVHG